MKKDDIKEKAVVGCISVIVGWAIGACCFDYSLWSVFGKDVPWYVDLIAGIILRQYVIPVWALCWVSRACGCAVPFYH